MKTKPKSLTRDHTNQILKGNSKETVTSLRAKFSNVRHALRGKRHTKTGAYARAGEDDDCGCSVCDEADKEWEGLLDEVEELRAGLEFKDKTLKELGGKVKKLEGVVERLVEGKLKGMDGRRRPEGISP